jgi:hypothetical protein
MPVDVGVASEQAVSADNAGFNLLARLHDREQRDHATQRKADVFNCVALLLEHGVRPKLHRREPGLDAFEFVSRKLAQNAVLYEVFCLHMPASVAPSVGQRPRHGPNDAPNSICCGDLELAYPYRRGGTIPRHYSRYPTDTKQHLATIR